MRIELSLNDNKYAIDVDSNCYTSIKFSTVSDENSKNFGKSSEQTLGYFSKLSSAALRLCREEISSSVDTVTLKQYASRVEDLNKQIKDQLDFINV